MKTLPAVTIVFLAIVPITGASARIMAPRTGSTLARAQQTNFDFCQRLLGDWAWFTDTPSGTIQGILSFADDHRVSASPRKGDAPALVGTWRCESTGHIIIKWQNAVEEYLDMSKDSRSVIGKNSLGMPVRGRPL